MCSRNQFLLHLFYTTDEGSYKLWNIRHTSSIFRKTIFRQILSMPLIFITTIHTQFATAFCLITWVQLNSNTDIPKPFSNTFRMYVNMYMYWVSYFPVEYSVMSVLKCYELSINSETFMRHCYEKSLHVAVYPWVWMRCSFHVH